MAALTVVLDACVLIPASLCDLLLRAAAADLYRFYWTPDILEEVRRTLTTDLGKTEDLAQRRVDAMKEAFPQVLITQHIPLISAMPNDPKDRHVLAAAVAGHAQIIVTSNLRDFLPETLAPFSVEAQSPDEFLCNLFDLDAELVVNIIIRQAQALRHPPMAPIAVLDALAKHAPTFVALVRPRIDGRAP